MTELNTDRIIGFVSPARYGKTNSIARMIQSIDLPIAIYDTNYEWTTQPQLRKIVNEKGNIIVLSPRKDKNTDMQYLNTFLNKILSTSTNLFIYVEDLEVFFNDTHNYTKFYGTIKQIAERSGHSRVGFIYSAKQLKYIPLSIINNTNLFYFGQLIEQKDISTANGIVKPEYDVRKIHKPIFIKVDRWDMSKKLVKFEKVF